MPASNQEIDRVRQARRVLDKIRGRLLRLESGALESSASDLQLAADCLRKVDLSLTSPIWQEPMRQKMEPEVVALRGAIQSIQALLANAGTFYGGLLRLLAPDDAPANYTASGANGPPASSVGGSIVLQG